MLTRLFASPLSDADPVWGGVGVALCGIIFGLALVTWGLRARDKHPLGAGCGLGLGILLFPLSVLVLLAAMNLSGDLGR